MCPDPFQEIVITCSPFSPSFTPQSFANCCSLQLSFKLSFQAVLSQNLQTVHKSNNFTNFPWFQTIFLLYLQIIVSDNCFACTCSRHLFAIIQIVVWSTFLQIVRHGACDQGCTAETCYAWRIYVENKLPIQRSEKINKPSWLELIVLNQVLTKCFLDNLFANCCSVNFFANCPSWN